MFRNVAGQPIISQQVSYSALTGEGIAVVIERTTAIAPVKLKASRALNLALGNDIFNYGLRKIANQGKEIALTGAKNLGTVEAADPKANAQSVTLMPVDSPWLCVDDRLGVALLDGGEGFTIHDCAGRNAPWGSIQYDVITAHERGARQLEAGESIIDSAFVLVAGDRKATARLQASSSVGAPADNPAVRYAIVTAPSGKRYLVVANIDGVARTVRIPKFAGMEFAFDGFGAQVREAANTGP